MLILQRMAMATSSSFLSIPLLKTSSLLSPVKHCASPLSSEFRALSLYGGRNGVSTSSAMATEAQVSTQDDKLKDAQMEVADKPEKVLLPTNESSKSLIRIRHGILLKSKEEELNYFIAELKINLCFFTRKIYEIRVG